MLFRKTEFTELTIGGSGSINSSDTLRTSETPSKFYLAFLDSNPQPDEMAIRAVNSGASKIIILPVFITESTHTVAGQEMVASINPESFGVQVCYTGALWDSQPVLATFSSARFFGFLGRYFVSRFLIFSVQGGLGFFEYALGSFG